LADSFEHLVSTVDFLRTATAQGLSHRCRLRCSRVVGHSVRGDLFYRSSPLPSGASATGHVLVLTGLIAPLFSRGRSMWDLKGKPGHRRTFLRQRIVRWRFSAQEESAHPFALAGVLLSAVVGYFCGAGGPAAAVESRSPSFPSQISPAMMRRTRFRRRNSGRHFDEPGKTMTRR